MNEIGIKEIEAAALTTWPTLQTAYDGLWVWRGARGYTKRANSIQCLDPNDGANAELRLARLAELSALHGLPPIFRVTPRTAPEAVQALDGQGWVQIDDSIVMTAPMPAEPFEIGAKIAYVEARSDEWCGLTARFGELDEDSTNTLSTMMALMACESCGVVVTEEDDTPVGTVMVAISSGIAMFYNVIVDAEKRGKGFGRAGMSAAINAAREVGATHLALQVEASNETAIGLYRSLGFDEAYRYHYRVPGELIR